MTYDANDFYGKSIRKVFYPAWESLIRRRPTLTLLRYLEQTQFRSADELVAVQMGSLRRLARHAYQNVAFYRRRFDEAGVDPERILAVDDLAKLRPLTREDAQASGDERVSRARPRVDIRKSTSGTSGQPLTFGYDLASEHWRQAVKLRSYEWAGYRIGARTLHYWGTAPAKTPTGRVRRVKVAIDRRLKRELYVDCNNRSNEALALAVDAIRRTRPEVLVCYTQAGVDLARYVLDHGSRDWPDMFVVCGAEKLYDADRPLLARAFGPGVFETYGSREVMLMGAECEAHNGLHVPMENLVVEVVVREGDRTRAAAPGEIGEVAVTDLHNFGMPFIRYMNGDLALAQEQTPCSCGRSLERLGGIEGRVTDTLRDGRGGRVGGTAILVLLAAVGDAVRQFQAVQHADGSVAFRYVPGPAFDEATRAYLASSLAAALPGQSISLERTSEIPSGPNGKRRVVIVEPVVAVAK